MPSQAELFARDFDIRFGAATSGMSGAEIPLFTAMCNVLSGCARHGVRAEIYHGSRYQVRFPGDGVHARYKARCELSDLLIVAFSSASREVRITYLQAKSERATVTNPLVHEYSANLEQWYLLSTRPRISGIGAAANMPPDLLSGAAMESVGSFGFFYRDTKNKFQIFYSSAASLSVTSRRANRGGSVKFGGIAMSYSPSGAVECLSAATSFDFAKSLFMMEIGTIIDLSDRKPGSASRWLAGGLREAMADSLRENKSIRVAEELVGLLEVDVDSLPQATLGAREVLVLQIEGGA